MYNSYNSQPDTSRTYTQTEVPAGTARRVTHGYHQQPTSWQQFERAKPERPAHFAPPQGTHGYGGPSTPVGGRRPQATTTLDYYKQKEYERQNNSSVYQYPSAQQHQYQQQERLRQLQQQQQRIEDERRREEERVRQEEERTRQEDERARQDEEWQRRRQQEQLQREEEERQRQMYQLQQSREEEKAKKEEKRRVAERQAQEAQRQYQQQLQQQLEQQQAQHQKEAQEPEQASPIGRILKEVDAIRLRYEANAYQALSGLEDHNKARVTYIELLNGQIDRLDMVETDGKNEVKLARKAAVETIQKLQSTLDAFVERETTLLKLMAADA